MTSFEVLRRPFGRPLRRRDLVHQVVPKRFALPLFASDCLSSVAYATEEILKVLALAGIAYFTDSMWLAVTITTMLAVVLLSYRQTIFAYPNGGGAYIVARDNLGEGAAQVAGCALLVDYVLTVSVSVAAGVANFASGVHQFFPSVPNFNSTALVAISFGVLGLMWYVNKRGVKESGKAFAFPTYFFLASIFLMLAVGLVKSLTGTLGNVHDVGNVIEANRNMSLFLLLRAFASGSTAVTGVEAVSNGVTAFEEPKSRNAATTMAIMCTLLGVMFLGITRLALVTHALPSESETVISQLGRTVFNAHSPFYVAVIFGTAAVLVMAANTSYADFPRLAALHAGDGFLPRWLTDRDNRLVYGVGITVLTIASGLLIVAFNADVSHLIPLYAIGVFLSFSISQTGMVIRWLKTSRLAPGDRIPSYSPEGTLVTTLEHDPRWRLKLAINAIGAVMTAIVTVIFAIAKFTEGAWIVVIVVPALVLAFFRIHHHYRTVQARLRVDDPDLDAYLATAVPRIRLLTVESLARHTLPALREVLQRQGGTTSLAVHVDVNDAATRALVERWERESLAARGLPLVVLPSEFGGGNVVGDLVDYVHGLLEADPELQVEVIIPEWTTGAGLPGWIFARALHHLTGARLKLAFLSEPRVTVTNYRYRLT